jgi:uncharacterized protein YeaC (DUF1315 family)
VRARAVEAMVDFDRLTPGQLLWARRLSFVPAWLWAGTRYPLHFAANRPLRTALLSYAAMGEPGAPDQLQFNRPITDYLAEGMPSYLEGIETPWGVERTRSISPVSTPVEMGASIAETAGFGPPGAKPIGESVNPLLEAGWNVAHGQDPNLEGLAPDVQLAQDLLSPSGEGLYPDDATILGRLGRETGVLPVRVNRQEALLRAKKEGAISPSEYLAAQSEQLGMGEPPPEVVKQYDLYVALGKIPDGTPPKERQKKALQLGGFPDIPVATDEQAENCYERFRSIQLHFYLEWHREMDRRIDAYIETH